MLKINNEFRIETDNMECRLIHTTLTADSVGKDKVIRKGGKPKDEMYHFVSMKQCLTKMLDLSIRKAKSIADLKKRITDVEELIKNLEI